MTPRLSVLLSSGLFFKAIDEHQTKHFFFLLFIIFIPRTIREQSFLTIATTPKSGEDRISELSLNRMIFVSFSAEPDDSRVEFLEADIYHIRLAAPVVLLVRLDPKTYELNFIDSLVTNFPEITRGPAGPAGPGRPIPPGGPTGPAGPNFPPIPGVPVGPRSPGIPG